MVAVVGENHRGKRDRDLATTWIEQVRCHGEIVKQNRAFGPRLHFCVTVKNITLPKKNQTSCRASLWRCE
jgi:hypothetical protein